jgi:hypothetical protein
MILRLETGSLPLDDKDRMGRILLLFEEEIKSRLIELLVEVGMRPRKFFVEEGRG